MKIRVIDYNLTFRLLFFPVDLVINRKFPLEDLFNFINSQTTNIININSSIENLKTQEALTFKNLHDDENIISDLCKYESRENVFHLRVWFEIKFLNIYKITETSKELKKCMKCAGEYAFLDNFFKDREFTEVDLPLNLDEIWKYKASRLDRIKPTECKIFNETIWRWYRNSSWYNKNLLYRFIEYDRDRCWPT